MHSENSLDPNSKTIPKGGTRSPIYETPAYRAEPYFNHGEQSFNINKNRPQNMIQPPSSAFFN